MARNKQHGMYARRLAGMVGGLLALALVAVASTYSATRVHANSGPGGTTVTTYETPGAATPPTTSTSTGTRTPKGVKNAPQSTAGGVVVDGSIHYNAPGHPLSERRW
jgi:hypothetical protein